MSSRHAQDELKRGPRASWAAWPVAPPEWLGVDLETLSRPKRITRELAWIKIITSELPWGLAPACTCQPVPSEVALGHTKIAHASHRTPQDRHKAEPRALRARPRLLETGSRLAQDSSRHTQDRAKIVQEPPTQPKTAEDKSQASPRHAKKALGAPEDSPRWAQDTPKTSSSKGQELLGLPGQWLLPSGSVWTWRP
jgi:hypothetical protein